MSHRWKRVFGERGSLRLRPDGRLVIVRGVHEIPFTQFSSGEKVVALLATRLLVLGASTRASFLWLDEPLEHLDPRNRRITASLMSAAGSGRAADPRDHVRGGPGPPARVGVVGPPPLRSHPRGLTNTTRPAHAHESTTPRS